MLGHKEGLNVMEKADPLFLLIGLPTIPVMLILGKMVRWEDFILKLWRKHSEKIPLINYLFPSGKSQVWLTFLVCIDLIPVRLYSNGRTTYAGL